MSCRPGQVVANEYEIKSLLGYGGVGEVYLVHHRTLKADFALKILIPRLRSREDVKARFRQESRALWELSHPSFVQVHHAGDDATIGPYIVMEVLSGRTLATLGKAHTPSFDDAMRLGIEIAEAAEVMHSVGIIHRDLKPENIFIAFGKRPHGVTEGPRPRNVKLLDLGAAKIARFERAPTEDDQTVGTGRYMSPEHVRCEALTPASDVYALAHILFEFVSRAHPFPDAPKEPSHLEFQLLHRDKPPRALSEVVRGTPTLLSDVLLQAMAKAPRERFQSMAAFACALGEARRQFLVDQAIGKTERISSADALATIEDVILESTHPDPAPPVGVGSIATLVEIHADGAAREHVLAYGEFIVGRGERADVRIQHGTLSSRHARLCVHPSGIAELFDEGSAAGTSINGKTLTYAMLAHGDRVRFGAITCEFRLESGAVTANGAGTTMSADLAPAMALPIPQAPVSEIPATELAPPVVERRPRWPFIVGLTLVFLAGIAVVLWFMTRRP